jgi:hypothetical protein
MEPLEPGKIARFAEQNSFHAPTFHNYFAQNNKNSTKYFIVPCGMAPETYKSLYAP